MARTAVVAGVGSGLGSSVARRFAEAGCSVGMLARSAEFLEDLEAELASTDGEALAVPTDLREPERVRAAFESVRTAFGPVDVLAYVATAGPKEGLLETSAEDFQNPWATNVLGGFVCAQEAGRDMLESGTGTMIFTGNTSAITGRGGSVGFTSAKFAARGLAQDLARELGPEGIHVAHVVVGTKIHPPEDLPADREPGTVVDPAAIADTYWQLVGQDRSAWTHELDLRPYATSF